MYFLLLLILDKKFEEGGRQMAASPTTPPPTLDSGWKRVVSFKLQHLHGTNTNTYFTIRWMWGYVDLKAGTKLATRSQSWPSSLPVTWLRYLPLSRPWSVVKQTILILKSSIMFDRARHPELSSECLHCAATILPGLAADASGGPGSL